MSNRKRGAPETDTEEIGTTPSHEVPPRKKRPTVFQNAQAIEDLGLQMTGMDARLVQITGLLSKLAGEETVQAQQSQDGDGTGRSMAAHYQAPPHPGTTVPTSVAMPAPPGTHPPHLLQFPRPEHMNQQPMVNPAPQHGIPYQSLTHHLAGTQIPHQPATVTGWTGAAAAAGSMPTPQPTAQRQNNLQFPPAPNPTLQAQVWDGATSLQDLEVDSTLTKQVAVALQAVANPFTGKSGKHNQFPHNFVTRGQKRQKPTLGDLSMGEYIWGFIQLIKKKEAGNPDLPFMNQHLEKLSEDTKSYQWEAVRTWSEDVCGRIAEKDLAWSDTYVIDRLQTEISHKRSLHDPVTQKQKVVKEDRGYEIPDHIKQAKQGPPCKEYQNGKCTHVTLVMGTGSSTFAHIA